MDITKIEIPVSKQSAKILSAMSSNSSTGLKVIYRSGKKVLEVYANTKSEDDIVDSDVGKRFCFYGSQFGADPNFSNEEFRG